MPKKNNPYVKIANETTEYTPEHILELEMCASDAVYCISKYFHIQHPVKGSVPFNLHPYQAEIIYRAQHNYYNIVTIARQGGKCVHEDTLIEIAESEHSQAVQTVSIKTLMDETAKDCNIHQNGKLKFIKSQLLNNKFVNTPKGMRPIKQIHKTVPYVEYLLKLENDTNLVCADEHIVATTKGDKQVQHLTTQDVVLTQDGNQTVRSVHTLAKESCMYDLELDDEYHYYYTNGIQSHNTTTIGAFLLWFAMFTNDATVLVVSNKGDNAKEVIERIKFMYESCPHWLKPGVTDDGYNKHSLRFDNGSRIISQATSENSGRGLSISLLFCYGGDNTVELMDTDGNQFKLTLDELYESLDQ